MHTYTHTHMHTHEYIHIHTGTHVHTHVHMCTHLNIRTYMYTHAHIHTHAHIYTHTHAYTYTPRTLSSSFDEIDTYQGLLLEAVFSTFPPALHKMLSQKLKFFASIKASEKTCFMCQLDSNLQGFEILLKGQCCTKRTSYLTYLDLCLLIFKEMIGIWLSVLFYLHHYWIFLMSP